MNQSDPLTLHDIRSILVSCGHKLSEALSLQLKALLASQGAYLPPAEDLLGEVNRILADLREWLQENGAPPGDAQAQNERNRLANAIIYVEGICAATKRLQEQVVRKEKSGVFFSDLGMREAGDVFGQACRQVRDVADALATGNPTLRNHVIAWCDHASHLMNQYTHMHEERLLKGNCSTQAADIYVALFEAFHEMCYNVRHLALVIPEDQEKI